MTSDPFSFGQLLMVGLPGPRLDGVARELVRDLKVGGIILFARNLEDPVQVWELNRDLQREALAATGQPLLIAMDQEGGPVQRLRAPFTLIPPARELGSRASPEEVELLARKTARELSLVGVNVNLAPVLDVARGPDCPLWERSYGPEPEKVAALGLAAIRGYLAGGVLPVAKHFPGLGDTLKDSHEELPRAASPDPRRETDLLPFRRAVEAGVPLIMTAHVLVPAWDAAPATLSPAALTGRLREGLGFGGVIMTDDLEMGAIAQQARVPQAAAAALAAGADLLLICRDWQGAPETAAFLARDLALGQRGQEAAARLQALKKRLGAPAPDRQEVEEYFRKRAGRD
ncbi:MAG: beta-N-acetylhexosaminidase [Thermodesulfobacteriota bacterium]